MDLFLILLCGFAALFLFNVVVVAFHGPWWLQPFQVLIVIGDHGTRFFRWLATHLANFFVWIASWFNGLLERLGAAFKQSFEDGVHAMWGGMPTWFITFWTVFCRTIAAAYDLVKPWMTWTVILAGVTIAATTSYYTLFVWTTKGQDWFGLSGIHDMVVPWAWEFISILFGLAVLVGIGYCIVTWPEPVVVDAGRGARLNQEEAAAAADATILRPRRPRTAPSM